MAIKLYRPQPPGRRHASVISSKDLTKVKPAKRLTMARKRISGRNNAGKITVRHRGGGAKRRLRLIDWRGDKFDIVARVKTLEYDPNRQANIALLHYLDGDKRYIVAPIGLRVGDEIIFSRQRVEIKAGNRMPLDQLPEGVVICSVELEPGKGSLLARSAGAWVQLMNIEGKYAQLRLPSGEVRLVPRQSLAMVGQISNPGARHVRLGKAGRMRHYGVRPSVRGKAMNPVDHPHGGGEGHNPIGLKHPKTPWGKPAIGVKTRRRRASARLILQSR